MRPSKDLIAVGLSLVPWFQSWRQVLEPPRREGLVVAAPWAGSAAPSGTWRRDLARRPPQAGWNGLSRRLLVVGCQDKAADGHWRDHLEEGLLYRYSTQGWQSVQLMGAERNRRRGQKFDRLLSLHCHLGDPTASTWRRGCRQTEDVATVSRRGFATLSGRRAADPRPGGPVACPGHLNIGDVGERIAVEVGEQPPGPRDWQQGFSDSNPCRTELTVRAVAWTLITPLRLRFTLAVP